MKEFHYVVDLYYTHRELRNPSQTGLSACAQTSLHAFCFFTVCHHCNVCRHFYCMSTLYFKQSMYFMYVYNIFSLAARLNINIKLLWKSMKCGSQYLCLTGQRVWPWMTGSHEPTGFTGCFRYLLLGRIKCTKSVLFIYKKHFWLQKW